VVFANVAFRKRLASRALLKLWFRFVVCETFRRAVNTRFEGVLAVRLCCVDVAQWWFTYILPCTLHQQHARRTTSMQQQPSRALSSLMHAQMLM
jgi:hypothetical protein